MRKLEKVKLGENPKLDKDGIYCLRDWTYRPLLDDKKKPEDKKEKEKE